MIARSAVRCRLSAEHDGDPIVVTLMFDADDGDSFPVEIHVAGTTRHHVASGWAEATNANACAGLAERLLDQITADARK